MVRKIVFFGNSEPYWMVIRPLAKVVMMQAKRALYENRSAVCWW
jgi:hypothetical protein